MRSLKENAEEAGYEFQYQQSMPAILITSPNHGSKRLWKRLLRQRPTNSTKSIWLRMQCTIFDQFVLQSPAFVCHGDPGTSKNLWGNDQGVDVTGHRMEGLKEGDLYGAFEIVQSLDESLAAAKAAELQVWMIAAIGLTICGSLSLIMLKSVRLISGNKRRRSAMMWL